MDLKIEERVNKDYEVIDYDIKDIHSLNKQQLTQAEKAIEYAMIPMPLGEMEDEMLKTLMVMVKPSQESSSDVAMRCNLLIQELQHYPADIFMHTLKIIKGSHTFFPSLHEFRLVGDWHYEKRVRLQALIHRCKERINNTSIDKPSK